MERERKEDEEDREKEKAEEEVSKLRAGKSREGGSRGRGEQRTPRRAHLSICRVLHVTRRAMLGRLRCAHAPRSSRPP